MNITKNEMYVIDRLKQGIPLKSYRIFQTTSKMVTRYKSGTEMINPRTVTSLIKKDLIQSIAETPERHNYKLNL